MIPLLLHTMKTLNTIHVGHQMIHKNQIIFILLYPVKRLHTAFRSIHHNTCILEQSLCNQQIHRHIIYHQYTCIGSINQLCISIFTFHLFTIPLIKVSNRFMVPDLLLYSRVKG